MKIYILGICGTFMAGIALLARELGFDVAGSDAHVYPPMSTQLRDAGIQLHDGYDAAALPTDVDVFIVGNAISRGNPQFEHILDNNLAYTSGPQWLYEQVLRDRWVLAVAGTHGKTTTSSMLAWILHDCGINAGYLIGGLGNNFSRSAYLGDAPFFVIEADEYDTALFDKRSKFIHYHPRTLVLNNLEFDHADIFDDLAAIKRQFHHLVRMMPASGLIIHNRDCAALDEVLEMGCWTGCLGFSAENKATDFKIGDDNQLLDRQKGDHYRIDLAQAGLFNAMNATAAALAARHAGIPLQESIKALSQFEGVKRRQEVIADIDGVRIIDDFAHHPTAIELTLKALKAETRGRLFAVIELRSNTMKMGVHASRFADSIAAADVVLMCEDKNPAWNLHEILESVSTIVHIEPDLEWVIEYLVKNSRDSDQIVIMSNGGFDNIQRRLIQAHAIQVRAMNNKSTSQSSDPVKIGKYEIEGRVGEGSMGVVYKAFDPFVQRPVAIKVAHVRGSLDQSKIKELHLAFFSEVYNAGKMHHPAVVGVYDAGQEGDNNYIVMEYVDGVTLQDYVIGGKTMSPDEVVEVIFQCARGLDYVHRQGVIHRDLKPGNIMFSREGEVKIMDFSIAHVETSVLRSGPGLLGSPMYLPPEQLMAEKQLVPQSDIYSLGATMYALLARRVPYRASSIESLIYQIANLEPDTLLDSQPAIPEHIVEIVSKAMQKEIGGRYQTAGELAEDLSRSLSRLRQVGDRIDVQEKWTTLRYLRFFRDFSDDQITEVVSACEWSEFDKGEVILSEGEKETSFFIIARGDVEVLNKGIVIGAMKEGDCFGEIAFLTKQRRGATIVAQSDVTLMGVSSILMEQASPETQIQYYRVFLENLISRLSQATVEQLEIGKSMGRV